MAHPTKIGKINGVRLEFLNSHLKTSNLTPLTQAPLTAPIKKAGFTLIELLLVLLLISILASIVTPLITKSIIRAKEATLKEDLFIMRKVIDDYYSDMGSYPPSLEVLVDKRYIRSSPNDQINESTTSWELVTAENGISDIKSGAEGKGQDDVSYKDL